LTKVKLTLEQAMKAQRRSKGIALLFVNLGATSGWVVNTSVNEHLKTVGIYL
jgi:ABC-type proline/glycine betaine transport system substrate-binding protein